MSKKVLVISSGNSCRSILVEALLNKYIPHLHALSAGIKVNAKVNPNVQTLLQNDGSWRNEYHPKTVDKMIDTDYDLVLCVCDKASKKMPVFKNETKIICIPYENHDKKNSFTLEKLFKQMKMEIIPILRIELSES